MERTLHARPGTVRAGPKHLPLLQCEGSIPAPLPAVTAGSLEKARHAVERYHQTYRHPTLPPLQISGLYALFPDQTPTTVFQYSWPTDPWPNASRPGVYLIFDALLDLRYVGKARCLGKRLHNYFAEGRAPDRACRVVHSTWRADPKFVATIAVHKAFEAPALEEFLIDELRPAENATPWAEEA